jgi:hypothetical protein
LQRDILIKKFHLLLYNSFLNPPSHIQVKEVWNNTSTQPKILIMDYIHSFHFSREKSCLPWICWWCRKFGLHQRCLC